MGKKFYQAVRWFGKPFSYQCIGLEKLKTLDGPAILVGNHLAEIGPIASVISIPRQLHLWASANLVDETKITNHLMDDFVIRTLHLKGQLGKAIAWTIGRIVLPLMARMEVVPVDRGDIVLSHAFQCSMQYLNQNELLMVFPEDPDLPIDPVSGLKPFMSGYLWLCKMIKDQRGIELPIIPVVIIKHKRRVIIGEPCYYQDSGNSKHDMLMLTRKLETIIKKMLLTNA
ncbi:MAG: hypothetical protein MUO40_08420 [Anaerolineaceae bacterium]|nr:hypothetical protein [Anaerolineaceae bacterium]